MPPDYGQKIHQFLAGYRFFSFALAAVLIQVTSLRSEPLDSQGYFVLSLVGFYTLLKVFSPLRWREASVGTYVVLGGDVVLSILLLLITEGLDSGYLAYSLAPVLTAALLSNLRVSLVIATLAALTPTVAHLLGSQISDEYVWVLETNHAPLLVLYIAMCFIAPILGNRSNLNILRLIESDAVTDERSRIRREVHDGLAQTLAYLNLKTSTVAASLEAKDPEKALGELDGIRTTLRSAHEDVRELLDQLTDQSVSKPLVRTLDEFVQDFGRRHDIQADFTVSKTLRNVAPRASLQLIRIAQEALTNVRKHANATQVWVTLEERQGDIELCVRDNGSGVSASSGNDQGLKKHHGLTIMKERAESIGGTLETTSSHGKGMEIRVSVPWERVRL